MLFLQLTVNYGTPECLFDYTVTCQKKKKEEILLNKVMDYLCGLFYTKLLESIVVWKQIN